MAAASKRRGSLVHMLNVAIRRPSVSRSDDHEFNVAYMQFTELQVAIEALRGHIKSYMSNVVGMYSSRSELGESFYTILSTTEGETPCKEFRLAEQTFFTSREQKKKADLDTPRMEASILDKIDQLMEMQRKLEKDIKVRKDLRTELDYYTEKVKKLHDKEHANTENSDDAKKRLRNDKNLDVAQAEYDAKNAPVMQALSSLAASRMEILQHLMLEWAKIQSSVSATYRTALHESTPTAEFLYDTANAKPSSSPHAADKEEKNPFVHSI